MVYEWDGSRARRSYLVKVGIVLLATVVTAGLPLWMVVNAMG
ncbi:hypothetical protein [Metarhizobium album]|nr:hypothetical protein [Rhizobium album]